MKKCIVSGAAGFVGANLVRRLVKEGHDVHALVRAESSRWRLSGLIKDITVHEIDLTDAEKVKSLANSICPDWIFHLAARGAYSWQNNPHEIMHANVHGTISLVEACLKTGFEAFINTGSSSEYGYKDHAPAEDEAIKPNSYYAVAKSAATHYCQFVSESQQVRIPTLRLYSVYGPYEEPNRFIPTLVIHALAKKLPPLVNADISRDFIYIDDVCDAYLKAATYAGNELNPIFNIGSGIQTTIAQAVQAVQKLVDLDVQPVWGSMNDRKWDTNTWVCRNDKARELLGWLPRFSFQDGLSKTIAWFEAIAPMKNYYENILLSTCSE